MKSAIAFLSCAFLTYVGFSQNLCNNFNNQGISNWVTHNNSSGAISNVTNNLNANSNGPLGAGDFALNVTDESGGTYIYNNSNFIGNYTKSLGSCLCFDFQLTTNAAGAFVSPSIFLASNFNPNAAISPGVNPSIMARFTSNLTITQNSNWVHICAPIDLCNNGALPSNNEGSWSMVTPGQICNNWQSLLNNVTTVLFAVDMSGWGGTEVFNIDNVCVIGCPLNNEGYCCPGKNLVVNGNFSNGNNGFMSQYNFDGTMSYGATTPGEYNIVNGAGASTISNGWTAQDPSTCSNSSGNFMVVNGANCGGGKKIIWSQSMAVKDWSSYKFCASAKNLKQCDFDVLPKLEVQFSMGQIGNITETINVNQGTCTWFTFEKNIDLWGYGNNLTISILLDESQSGDGNDIALDNIALIEIPKCPTSAATFQITTQGINNTDYQITATSTTTPDCSATWWEVCEFDFNTNSCISSTTVANIPAWWFAITNFPNYNNNGSPGIFKYGKIYRITRGTWGKCHGWASFSRYIGSSAKSKKIQTFTEEQVKADKQSVLKALK